jgi:hypothetical protein
VADDPGSADGKKIMTVAVAALLYAASSAWNETTLARAFAEAEGFVAEAERRYGKIDLD